MKVNISENQQTFRKNGSIEHFQKNAITKTEEKAKQKPVIYNYTRQAARSSAEKVAAVLITAASIGIAGIAIIKNRSIKEQLKKSAKKLLEKDKKLKEAEEKATKAVKVQKTEEKCKQKTTTASQTESVCSNKDSAQKIKKESNSDLPDSQYRTDSYSEPKQIIEQTDETIRQTSVLNIKKTASQYNTERDFFGYIEVFIAKSIDNFCNFIRSL